MNEPKQEKAPKNKKVGADGLSKKERRALKVQETKQTAPASEQNNSETKQTISQTQQNTVQNLEKPIDNKQHANHKREVIETRQETIKNKQEANQNKQNITQNKQSLSQNKHNIPKKISAVETISPSPDNKQKSPKKQDKEEVISEGKTAVELKAERKLLFEKQRALQAKEIKPQDQAKEKDDRENKEATETGKSKAQMRAERRALQEMQREAKAKGEQSNPGQPNAEQTKIGQPKSKPAPKTTDKENLNKKASSKETTKKTDKIPIRKKATAKKDVRSFPKHPHLQMVEHMYYKTPIDDIEAVRSSIHPAFVELGMQFAYKTIVGANSRCLALLSALKQLITDYCPPANQEFCRSLETYLQNCVVYLQSCRPLAASMTNTLRYFKLRLTKLETALSDSEKKTELMEIIDTYIVDEIEKAGEAVSMKVQGKIANGDVILTYDCSSLIEKILIDAHKNNKKFKVIVADGRPFSEGKALLIRLLAAGIPCSYVLINGISCIMSQVTKIMLGSHSLLSNGFVMSRIGTAQIAMIGRDFNKPVLICCETYKFSERVQTDSYVYNEIGDSHQLASIDMQEMNNNLSSWNDSDVVPLHLVYDVAPPDLVTAVITELGILPCTSVPVVLRYKPSELSY